MQIRTAALLALALAALLTACQPVSPGSRAYAPYDHMTNRPVPE